MAERKKIRLIIAGQLADLSEDNLLLWNYNIEDLESPAAVKNSYTQSVTLPATSANALIFDHIERLDRYQWSGRFNPIKRTAFELRDEKEDILMSGYLKLDSIKRTGRKVTGYEVTLYGGLGSFLYGLTYKDNGDKMTLADLDYTTAGGSDELNFTINKAAIKSAWENIVSPLSSGDTGYAEKWHIVNFAPAYEGKPDDFDANKILVETSDGNTYLPTTGAHGSHVLVTLDEEVTASEVRDFRSYLQRPVIKVTKVFDAIERFATAKGYTMTWPITLQDDIHQMAWCTLKPITGIDYTKTDTFTDQLQFLIPSGGRDAHAWVIPIDIYRQQIPSAITSATLNFSMGISYAGTEDALYKTNSNTKAGFAVQLQALDALGNICGKSAVKIFTNGYTGGNYSTIAASLWGSCLLNSALDPETYFNTGSTGKMVFATGSTYTAVNANYRRVGSTDTFALVDGSDNTSFDLSITGATGVVKYRLVCGFLQDSTYSLASPERFFTNPDTSVIRYADTTGTPAFVSSTESRTQTKARTGATITKALLLDTDYSPAEFLVSYCKQRGWLILCDTAEKKITITDKTQFYASAVTDIHSRIDRSREMSVTPCVAQAKIYRLAVDQLDTEAEDAYETENGNTYGEHRLNTNYEFEGDAVEVIKDNIFKACIQYCKSGHRYALPIYGGSTLWSWQTLAYKVTAGTKGSTTDTEFAGITPTSWSHYNDAVNFADAFSRPLFHGDGDKAVDATPVLLLFQQGKGYQGPEYIISDDTAEMFYQNDDKPCWYQAFGAGSYVLSDANYLPQFRRWLVKSTNTRTMCEHLDLGDAAICYDPRINGFEYPASIWAIEWEFWMADRYQQNAKIVTCYVDLRGYEVNEAFLSRKFYFDGCYWRLNKVTDYDLQGGGVTKCEFIKTEI